MTNEYIETDLYDAAWKMWGDLQYTMVIEECAELQKTCTKILRGKKSPAEMAEELADVEVMLAQMKFIHKLDAAVNKIKQQKLGRLAEMIYEAQTSHE